MASSVARQKSKGISGRKIVLSLFVRPLNKYKMEKASHTNIIVNYLPTDMADQDLYDLFIPYGRIRQHKIIRAKDTGHSLGYGFVDFAMEISAEAALRYANGLEYHGKRLKVALARPRGGDYINTNLFVSLPPTVDRDQLRTLFERYGPIIDVKILRDKATGDSRGIAFVRFELHSAAQKAMDELHMRHTFDGAKRAITVQFARRLQLENQGGRAFHLDLEREGKTLQNKIYRSLKLIKQFKILCKRPCEQNIKIEEEAQEEKPDIQNEANKLPRGFHVPEIKEKSFFPEPEPDMQVRGYGLDREVVDSEPVPEMLPLMIKIAIYLCIFAVYLYYTLRYY